MKGTGLTIPRDFSAAQEDPSEGAGPSWLGGVLRQFEGPLVIYASRITRDVERARDVVQESFLRLLKEDRRTIEPYLAEWLYTVCRNKALDVRRKEKRTIGLTDKALCSEASVDDGPERQLELQESASRAMRFLTHLPDNQQEVIRLKFQHGLSYKEISGVTKLSVTNVGFLLHTGLKTLREKMGAA